VGMLCPKEELCMGIEDTRALLGWRDGARHCIGRTFLPPVPSSWNAFKPAVLTLDDEQK
jgi:hypothetical protein